VTRVVATLARRYAGVFASAESHGALQKDERMRKAPTVGGPPPTAGTWGGKAAFNGAVVLTEAPTPVVADCLPGSLAVLEGAPSSCAGVHPLLFVFGEMVEGGAHVLGVNYSAGISYRELAVLVPFVRHSEGSTPFLFAQQMLADDARAVLLGNTVYGYRKQLARIKTAGPTYEGYLRERVVFSSTGSVKGPWSSVVAAGSARLSWLRSLLSLPILGCHASGQLVRSSFDWDFHCASLCELEVCLEWQAPQRRLRLKSLAGRAVGIHGLLWRTSPPRLLGTTVGVSRT
jgi:hypothetical protein